MKNQNGKYRNDLITNYKKVPFKSCYTATPAPNDFMEFGNHVEFLTNMTMTEMLSTFFVHDGGDSCWCCLQPTVVVVAVATVGCSMMTGTVTTGRSGWRWGQQYWW